LNIHNIDQYNITIHSHTDNIGGVEFNEWLSQMRSQSAMDQLLINNIRQEMIEIKDFGLHNPVYDNSTWEGKLKNRRVDIFLWPQVL
ncbi:MAG: OmpA family protein, partial [Cyclobacteriaceae bacterium]|nr:OmpA family protein [Cyclobacteriaceae bacterium]